MKDICKNKQLEKANLAKKNLKSVISSILFFNKGEIKVKANKLYIRNRLGEYICSSPHVKIT